MSGLNVVIGSKNPCKVETAKRVLKSYPMFEDAIVLGAIVDSGVSAQPQSLEEMVKGAASRAHGAWQLLFDYAIGFESGIFQIAGRWFDAAFCHIFGCTCGPRPCLSTCRPVYLEGMSCAFPVPPRIIQLIEEGVEMADAVAMLGWADASNKMAGGLIELLTAGRVRREDQIEQALQMALTKLVMPMYWGERLAIPAFPPAGVQQKDVNPNDIVELRDVVEKLRCGEYERR